MVYIEKSPILGVLFVKKSGFNATEIGVFFKDNG